jgi:hypothetical protein
MRWIRPDSWGFLDTNVLTGLVVPASDQLAAGHYGHRGQEEGGLEDGRPDSCEPSSVACPG